ncbi:nodulation protein NodZ [Bradyrhizobium sp. CB3481]|uniref:nodulation protein NodZ n=1 Tax=Bradyrhizobium sp. CB3481 TaxID=3039158 RepID=UPI0024B09B22|nr:nodulation protein NodZ [Bradyrhizobium sp. CB3481]WFU18775.1 nodulation protein NodZ [Bradyrhizobium sp. CB3481]
MTGNIAQIDRDVIIARHCFGGIGDHLSCLIGAWWLARRTARTLVVDWRGSRFNADPTMRRNCFFHYFEPRQAMGGVRIIADDSVGGLQYRTPIWPAKWTQADLTSSDHLKHSAEEVAAVNELVTSERKPIEPTVVLNQWVEPPPPREMVRLLLAELHLAEPIRAEAQGFWNEQIGSAFAVGIHLRHGNGENVGARAAYWLSPFALSRQLSLNARNDVHRPGLFGRFSDNMPASFVGMSSQAGAERRFCRKVAADFHAFAERLNAVNAVPFLFCDSMQIIDTLREFLPNLVVRPKVLPEKGDGPLHQFEAKPVGQNGTRIGTVPEQVTLDMFVELDLMQRCQALMYMDSGFSILARTMLEQSRQLRLQPSRTNRLIVRAMS